MSTKSLSVVCLLVAMFVTVGAWAAADQRQETGTSTSASLFSPKIDTWAEGQISSIDPQNGKLTIMGHKMNFATAVAQMESEVHNKTANLQGAEKQKKTAEIRKEWMGKLNKARLQQPGENQEITVSVPAQGKLAIYNGQDIRNVAFLKAQQAAGKEAGAEAGQPVSYEQGMKENIQPTNKTLKDLKVGDRVMVGFDSGVMTNDAYALIEASGQAGQAGQQPTEEGAR